MNRALNGDAWHGPSWRETLDGVTRDVALHRPIPEAHSIAEIVLHATTWHDVVRRRLGGEVPEVTESLDWPPPNFKDEAAWKAAVGRLFETGTALVTTVSRFPAEKLLEKRPNVEDTWFALVIGELQHMLYHAGQIGVLKKAHARVEV